MRRAAAASTAGAMSSRARVINGIPSRVALRGGAWYVRCVTGFGVGAARSGCFGFWLGVPAAFEGCGRAGTGSAACGAVTLGGEGVGVGEAGVGDGEAGVGTGALGGEGSGRGVGGGSGRGVGGGGAGGLAGGLSHGRFHTRLNCSWGAVRAVTATYECGQASHPTVTREWPPSVSTTIRRHPGAGPAVTSTRTPLGGGLSVSAVSARTAPLVSATEPSTTTAATLTRISPLRADVIPHSVMSSRLCRQTCGQSGYVTLPSDEACHDLAFEWTGVRGSRSRPGRPAPTRSSRLSVGTINSAVASARTPA